MKKSIFNRVGVGFIAFSLVLAQVVMPVQSAFANEHQGGSNPPGNNGTIKIGEFDADEESTTNANDPHIQGCALSVGFYGYDAGARTATVTFEAQDPTDESQLVTPTGDQPVSFTASGAANELNHTETFTLSFQGDPQPNQGYHVKVTVRADDSRGKNTKFKTIWVEGCEPTSATPTLNVVAGPCVEEEDTDGTATATITNPSDNTLAAVTYDWELHQGASLIQSGTTASVLDGTQTTVNLSGLSAGLYTFSVTGSDGTTAEATLTLTSCIPEDERVTAVDGVLADICGTNFNLTFTPATTVGVTYQATQEGDTITVTATAEEGYVLTNPEWSQTATDRLEPCATPCVLPDMTYIQPWAYNGATYPLAAADLEEGTVPGSFEFVNNSTFTGLLVNTPATESYVYGYIDAGKTSILDIDKMSYTTYRLPESAGYEQTLPAYRLLIDKDGNLATNDTTRLYYEPYNNSTVAEGEWQTWDAIDDGDAIWWMDETGQKLETWEHFTTTFPDAIVLAYGFNQGTYNAHTFAYIKSITFDCGTTTFSAPGKGENPVTPTPETPVTPVVPVVTPTLPAELPYTGPAEAGSAKGLLLALAAAVATYGAVYFAQPKRRYE